MPIDWNRKPEAILMHEFKLNLFLSMFVASFTRNHVKWEQSPQKCQLLMKLFMKLYKCLVTPLFVQRSSKLHFILLVHIYYISVCFRFIFAHCPFVFIICCVCVSIKFIYCTSNEPREIQFLFNFKFFFLVFGSLFFNFISLNVLIFFFCSTSGRRRENFFRRLKQ